MNLDYVLWMTVDFEFGSIRIMYFE